MVRDSCEDLEVNDETLTVADSQLVETFGLEYGGIYNNSEGSDSDFFTARTIQKKLKQRCFSDLLALQRALQKGCTNAVFRSLQQCIFVTALTLR